MQFLKTLFTLLFILSMLFACGGAGESNESDEDNSENEPNTEEQSQEEVSDEMVESTLTDDKVKKYIALIGDIKKENPDFDSQNALAGVADFNKYVRKHGFESMQEFIQVNLKVATSYAYLVAEEENVVEKYEEGQEEAIKELEEKLNDENIPEAQKIQLKKTIEMMRQNQEDGGMKNMAEKVLEGYEAVATEEDRAAVKRHLPELKKVLKNE